MLGSTGTFSGSLIVSSGLSPGSKTAWLASRGAKRGLGKEGGSQSEGKLKREERTEADLGGGPE